MLRVNYNTVIKGLVCQPQKLNLSLKTHLVGNRINADFGYFTIFT